MIQIEGLIKDYGNFRALTDISVDIKKGEVIGLLGPNGAGKTTLMRILTGYIPASLGSVKIAGKDILDEPKDVKKLIGYLPENCPLYPDMTVRDFLLSMAETKGIKGSKLKERLEYVLDAVNLKDREKSFISTLSKGYRQRVGLAQSLIHDPQILILDEPTVGLDPNQIIEIRDLIMSLKGDRTIILSSHILPEVSQLCERIIVIADGSIVAQGSESELVSQVSGSHKVHVLVQERVQEAMDLIKTIDGVQDVLIDHNNLIEAKIQRDKDLRSQIAQVLIKSNFKLLELRGGEMTLEEIFIRLTQAN